MNYTQNEKIEQVTDSTMVIRVDFWKERHLLMKHICS